MFIASLLLAAIQPAPAMNNVVDGRKWPSVPPGPIISSPDWADYNIYPPAARRADQEGKVRSLLLIDENGRTIDCVVVVSSGFRELDEGTCERMRAVRFVPAMVDGKRVQSSRSLAISWVLGDQIALSRSRATATLKLAEGRIASCTLTTEGPHFQPYERSGCIPLDAQIATLASLKGRDMVRVELDVIPKGESFTEPRERPWARQRVSFEVNAKGDPVNCITLLREGDARLLGSDQSSTCSDQLRRLWFDAPADKEQISGLFEIRFMLTAD